MSDLELSQEKRISVVRRGISMGELEESFSIMSTENNALVFDRFVHSVISLKNHESTTPVPKNMLKRKADEELAIPSGAHEKRPRMEAAMKQIESDHQEAMGMGMGIRFLIYVTVCWLWMEEWKNASFYALIDTGADVSLFDINFLEEKKIP